MPQEPVAPRLYVLPARVAPVALILRRGPTEWFHLLRWDLRTLEVDTGAWFHGTIYPRRCDISPDGRLLCYFAMGRGPAPWDTYIGVSKVPWLTALAAWHVGSTWAFGCEFLDEGSLAVSFNPADPPDHGRFDGRVVAREPRASTFVGRSAFDERDVANELRRGWEPVDIEGSEPFLAELPIPDRSIHLALRRSRPTDRSVALVMAHAGHTFAEPRIEGVEVAYVLEGGSNAEAVEDAAWADWDADGRLLVATSDGQVQIREPSAAGWDVVWSHDLGGLAPDPQEAPAWAQSW